MPRRALALFTAVLLTAATATTAACGDDDTGGTPGQPDRVKAGVIAILDVAPIYLGKEKGFFSRRGIELTLETGQGGSQIAPNVLSGQYQFGFSNVVSLLLAKAQNAPLKVVANGVNSTGDPNADFGGIVVKDPAITSAKDLAGKKVATNALKNIVDTSVKEIVRKDGGDPSKVSFVELAFPDMAAQLDAGNVQGIFVVEPFLSAAKAKGWRVVASYADVDPDLCVAVYFTSLSTAQSRPDLVERFTEAMNESLAYADANPDEVRRILGTYTQITEEVRRALTLPTWPATINRDAVNRLADLSVEYGLIKAKPDVASMLP